MSERPSIWGNWRQDRGVYLLVAAVLFVAVPVLSALSSAWGERRFISEFFAWFFTYAIHMGLLFGAIIGGTIFIVERASRRTRSAPLLWAIGVAALVALIFLTGAIEDAIPGLRWRFHLMRDSGDY